MKAWTRQRKKDIKTLGKSKAPHIVFWNDPDGKRKSKSCGSGREGYRLAQKEKQRLHGELITGTYESLRGGSWEQFRKEYDEKILALMGHGTKLCTKSALAHFE